MKTIFLLASALLTVSAINGCKKSSATNSSNPGTNEVFMQNNAFTPASITVTVNTTVKWVNKDGFAHTVTSNTNLFDSGTINGGGTYSRQFTVAGTYPYKCTIHSTMSGTVIVQ